MFGREVEVNGRETGGWRVVTGQDDGEEEGKIGGSPERERLGRTGGKTWTGNWGVEEEVREIGATGRMRGEENGDGGRGEGEDDGGGGGGGGGLRMAASR